MAAKLEEALLDAPDDVKSLQKIFLDFFQDSPPAEPLLRLSPLLGAHETSSDDGAAVTAQARRLLQIWLLQQDGVKETAMFFGHRSQAQDKIGLRNMSWLQDILQISQLIATIPDKAGIDAPKALQSPLYHEAVARQLLSAAEKRWEETTSTDDGTFVFVGEVISRLCRRGQADVISRVYVPVLMQQVMAKVGDEADLEMTEDLKERNLWTWMFASIKDSHAMEKLVEAILREMAVQIEADEMACCMLWMVFGSLLSNHNLIRMVFLDKCLFVKVLPIRCLKWILGFAVLHESHMDTEVVRRLAQVWSSNDLIRSASLPKQACILT